MKKDGKLVIISAPSGAGKTTIVRYLIDTGLNLSFSVSATTRPIRGCEKQGIDYFYLTVPEFKQKIENNEFVEWQEVYKDLYYGTLKSELLRIFTSGSNVLFDVDAKGGINLKKIFGSESVAIFIMPPSIEELENRLITRCTESPEKIKIRVDKAKDEIKLADRFDRIIINNNLEKAKEEAFKIVSEFLEG
jgi:guanylate kinase